MIPTLSTMARCDTHRYTLLTSAGACPTCEALPWITVGDHEKAEAVQEQERRAHLWAAAGGRMYREGQGRLAEKRRQRALIASEASRQARLRERAQVAR